MAGSYKQADPKNPVLNKLNLKQSQTITNKRLFNRRILTRSSKNGQKEIRKEIDEQKKRQKDVKIHNKNFDQK